MLPKDLQESALDKCAVSWDKVKESDAMTIFNKVKEEVKNIAKSRRDMCTPKARRWTKCGPSRGRTITRRTTKKAMKTRVK